jgi:hypothetical protein
MAKHPPAMFLVSVHLLLGCLFFRRLTWRSLDHTQGARFFVTAVSATITWQLAFYDYNFYYDQAHYFDRFLVIGLAILVFFHPMFAPLFTAFVITIASQLHYPLPDAAWLWPDKKLLFDAMILFNAFLLFAAFRNTTSHLFLYVLLCLTAGIYFHAGVAKLSIGPGYHSWLVDNKLSNLFVTSHTLGWLGYLDKSTIINIAKLLETVNCPIAAVTLLIEFSGVAILWSRYVARLVLCSFIMLHVAIGLASGIFFWMWCAHNVALIIYITKSKSFSNRDLFCPKSFVLSVAVILFSSLYFRPVHFAWFDTRLSNFFTIYGTGASGNIYELEPHFFAPYDIIFGQSRFYYLFNETVLVGTYGSTQDYWLAQQLETASPIEIDALKGEHGETFYNEHSSRQLIKFIKNYVSNSQKGSSQSLLLSSFGPPYHFGSARANNSYDFQEHLTRVQIYYEEHFFDGQDSSRIRRTLVREIPIEYSD